VIADIAVIGMCVDGRVPQENSALLSNPLESRPFTVITSDHGDVGDLRCAE
jgi:hypothetical protein